MNEQSVHRRIADVVLRPLERADFPRCAALERELFPGDDPWSEHAFEVEVQAGHLYLAAEVAGELVGYAGLALLGRKPHHEADVHNIAVAAAWQGRGIGRALLGHLLARADDDGYPVFLEVRTDNEQAIGLYEAHGFHRIGVRRRYYASGADAYTMRRLPNGVADGSTVEG